MAVPMGKPATSFNAQNRKWVKDMLDGGGGSGGSGLPDITEQDEGKVLTVDNGEAVWDTLPQSPISYVSVTWEEDTGTMSKTWQEIYNDISAGKLIIMVEAEEEGATCYLVTSCVINVDTYEVTVTNFGLTPVEVYKYTTNSANGYPSITD